MRNKSKSDTDIVQAFRDRVRTRVGNLGAKKSWYDIRNADGDVAEIRIYEEIHWFWGIAAEDFAEELDEITAPEILVMINSPGGDVFDGIAIYNALRAHPAKVTTRVDGIAASVASVIAQAGDHRIMLTGAQMMIHEAWGLAIGTSKDMRDYADLLDRQNKNIAGIYARRANLDDKDADYFRDSMTEDKWFDADETVAEGLADEVVDLPPNAETAKDAGRQTLQNEIEEAMDVVSRTIESAERVAALRAQKGKDLSQVNRDGLDELKQSLERLDGLVEGAEGQEQDVEPAEEPEPTEGDSVVEAARAEYLRYVSSDL